MKILNVEAFHSGLKDMEETLSSQKDQVEQIEKAVTDVVNLDEAFKGEGGEAIRDFYRSKHLPMLEKYQLFLSDYQSVLRQMTEALYSLEPSPAGFIRQSFLEGDVEQGIQRARQTTMDLTSEANAALRSVSDIVSVPRIQDGPFLQQAAFAQREKERSIEKLLEFDHTQTSSLSSLEKQVHSMTQEITQLQTIFQEGKIGIIEKNKKMILDESSFLTKLSELASVWLSQKSSQFLGTLEGSFFAIVDIVSGLADSLIALFTDPIGLFKGAINTVLHPIDTAKYIWNDLKQSYEEDVVNGDIRSRARYSSYAETYIAASIFGTRGVDKVSIVGKAGKMNSKPDVPYNVLTTAKIKSSIKNGVKSTFGKVEDTVHNLLSSRSGKRAMELDRLSSHLKDLFRKTRNVLNPDKIKTAIDKTYQKVAAGPISKAVQSDVFSRMGRVLLNEKGHVVIPGKGKVSQGERVTEKVDGLKSKRLSSEQIELDWLADKYTAVEVKGTVKVGGKKVDVSRRVYQIEIDKNYVPNNPKALGKSNGELMKKGKSPYIVNDGVESKVELHHLIQKEPGGMVEIAEFTHDKYDSMLHGLIENGNSFRNNPELEKMYNNFRSNYWKMRASE
ncbi:hypothetical protein D3H55_10050 [Bacillus salacetis]|uniref:LXG domain-containing protein n=1 Tax=Bacillus salacetis TaxID=2315464 RepID=A0A3A1R0L6_9BACI|nr:T7SS effector LXG polymorphic toxin [Bacillus salacetis]RIW34308.1 hypothetical protein D3H55_10050 [Bacillus salacetis]